jgi:hypothetical protein
MLVKKIVCEDPYQTMWATFVWFESEPIVQDFLQRQYEQNCTENAKMYAFQNTERFIFAIKQAREYYRAAAQSDLLVKPLLLYYGMVSLIKAVLIASDPAYPRNTRVLQHGLSTRRRKARQYRFLDDSCQPQREGLFPLFATACSAPDEARMAEQTPRRLLALIPDLRHSYMRLVGTPSCLPIAARREGNRVTVDVPTSVLDFWHVTASRFVDLLNQHRIGAGTFSLGSTTTQPATFTLQWNHPALPAADGEDGSVDFENRLIRYDVQGQPYLLLERRSSHLLPEACAHVCLMYMLGILCRYEPELWGQYAHGVAVSETALISDFLRCSQRKFPNLILNLLHGFPLVFAVS